MTDQEEKKFEVCLEELEEVVEQLEAGDLSLEEALAAYEKGIRLVRQCGEKLNAVEKRIEVLIKDKEGKLQLKAFDPQASESDEQ